jgi:hypothetical protein
MRCVESLFRARKAALARLRRSSINCIGLASEEYRKSVVQSDQNKEQGPMLDPDQQSYGFRRKTRFTQGVEHWNWWRRR